MDLLGCQGQGAEQSRQRDAVAETAFRCQGMPHILWYASILQDGIDQRDFGRDHYHSQAHRFPQRQDRQD